MSEKEDDTASQREERLSDIPVDLGQERESFVRQFLRKGVELTEGLIEENQALRDDLASAQREMARLRAQIASDDAIRDLLRKIEELEMERRSLLDRSTELEENTRKTQHRNTEVEQELHDLANLYIASSHLHSTLSVRGVVRHVKELLQQLIGAEAFVIYLLDDAGEHAAPLAADGYDEAELASIVPGEGPIGEVLVTGLPRVADRVDEGSDLDNPIATIPLMIKDRPVGAIAITSLFLQKPVWAAVDHELFKLLGAHAAVALVAANLYAPVAGPAEALRGLRSQLSSNP